MGNETIFYYVTEETITGSSRCAKKPFRWKIGTESFVVEKEEMTIVTILIPTLPKGWKREKLIRLMQKSAQKHPCYSNNAKILMQPAVQLWLTGRCGEAAYDDRPVFHDDMFNICFSMAENILRERFSLQDSAAYPKSVVLLMGTYFFTEEQIQHFAGMIQPYLPRINAFTIVYEKEEGAEAADAEEVFDFADDRNLTESVENAGTERHEEIIHEYTEQLYYEYGLVGQVICGTEASGGRYGGLNGQGPILFLDYGYSGAMPFRMLKEEGFYLDIASSEQKEALFRRKYREIFYQSPRKYLDTVVKSGYDK